MTSDRIARDYLVRAGLRRKALATLVEGGAFADVVREAHETAELILKGALRLVGVDPPKRHDVAKAVRAAETRFPSSCRADLMEAADAASALARERGHAFYGDEDALVPASELFNAEDAREAVELVDRLLRVSASLLELS